MSLSHPFWNTLKQYLLVSLIISGPILFICYIADAISLKEKEYTEKNIVATNASAKLAYSGYLKETSTKSLMEGIQKKKIGEVLVYKEAYHTQLFYTLQGTSELHKLTVPQSSYVALESLLISNKIALEFKGEEFKLLNPELFTETVAEPTLATKVSQNQHILVIAAGIALCLAPIWLITAPLRSKEGAATPSNPNMPSKGEFNAIGSQEEGAILPFQIEGSLDDLVGLEDIKAEVLHLEHMLKNKAQYESHGLYKPFNVLLSGPSGTGKSKIVSYLAKQIGCPMFSISAGNIETGLVGGGSNTLTKVYAQAQKFPLSIVFLDEGQTLLAKRGMDLGRKNADDTANAFLTILDGTALIKTSQVITVLASNFDDTKIPMDEAVLRRFSSKIDFRLPNLMERKAIFEHYMAKKSPKLLGTIDFEYMAEVSAGLSPALINTVTDTASLIAIREDKLIDTHLLMKAYERVTIGITDRATTAGKEEERKRIAIHELGHFFMQIHPDIKNNLSFEEIKAKSKFLKISTEAIAKVNALGFVLSSQEEATLQTKSALEAKVMELYGGAAAEEIFYGKDNLSIGSSNDFDKATKILELLVSKVSMYSHSKINYSLVGKDMKDTQLTLMESKSEELYKTTLEAISFYMPYILKLTDKLLTAYVFSKDEMFEELEKVLPIHPHNLHPQKTNQIPLVG